MACEDDTHMTGSCPTYHRCSVYRLETTPGSGWAEETRTLYSIQAGEEIECLARTRFSEHRVVPESFSRDRICPSAVGTDTKNVPKRASDTASTETGPSGWGRGLSSARTVPVLCVRERQDERATSHESDDGGEE